MCLVLVFVFCSWSWCVSNLGRAFVFGVGLSSWSFVLVVCLGLLSWFALLIMPYLVLFLLCIACLVLVFCFVHLSTFSVMDLAWFVINLGRACVFGVGLLTLSFVLVVYLGILSWFVLLCRILSCLSCVLPFGGETGVSCLVLPCLVLSWLVLLCVALHPLDLSCSVCLLLSSLAWNQILNLT